MLIVQIRNNLIVTLFLNLSKKIIKLFNNNFGTLILNGSAKLDFTKNSPFFKFSISLLGIQVSSSIALRLLRSLFPLIITPTDSNAFCK